MKDDAFDVVVIGAGMVGACCAQALAAKGMRIALVEAAVPADPDSGEAYDLRVSAISPGSRAILQGFGIWQQLDAARICYYEQMHIWHQHGTACIEFDAVDLARDNLGAIVENRQLQQCLHRACEALSNIEWLMPDRIEQLVENGPEGVVLRMASGRLLQAGLLIAADGKNSPTRRLAGIRPQQGRYRQTAIVANVDTELAHRHTAWQRFLATGPLAFLPLANGQSSIVWSCDDDVVAGLLEADDDEFCQRLATAFEFKLGDVVGCSARASFPLTWHSCETWLQDRLLLIGDAAHSVHPLAGQGVNLGFSDVDLLARLICDPSRLAGRQALRRFERQRKSETWLATRSFSSLKWLFGLDRKSVSGIRDLGMRIVNETPWFKRALMQKAVQNIT